MVLIGLFYISFAAALLALSAPVNATTDYPPGTTVCILPSGNKSTTASECSTGELFLIGQYVNLGINNVGSFGASSIFQSSYHTGKLGFIADYDRNGFASTPAPGFAGDYFATLLPVEGKYVELSSSTLVRHYPHHRVFLSRRNFRLADAVQCRGCQWVYFHRLRRTHGPFGHAAE